MMRPGTESQPLRVAILGSGPAGFYAADHLLRQANVVAEVDMIDRLPTPYGLVRAGVAPDHQKIKSVTAAFDKVAAHPRFRFYGWIDFGKDIAVGDLRRHYHQILYSTGAQTDRRMGIPGEDLKGSHPATEFVAWYNGHPDYRDCQFDLTQERVAVVGVGNVAIDVARILCRSPAELAKTDIADYALEALRGSRVKEVYLLGRRGPAQAAFTNPEVKELGELEDADVLARPEEVVLDDLSRAAVEASGDRATLKKVELLKSYAKRVPVGRSKQLIIRFLVSPVELVGNETGEVVAMRLVRNRLESTQAGTLQARATGEFETLPVGLVFRSVGYRGLPLPGVPFHENWGVILNENGRVLDPDTKQPVVGEYAAGWIKRGPTGVIGTNKPDAAQTVDCMIEDLAAGRVLSPDEPDVAAVERMLRERQPRLFSYDDWRRLNELEVARGQALGRPRVKFTRVEDMLVALGRSTSTPGS
ncbi:MAG: NADP oxidoreductase [Candidatus Rokuibacteriota bacterium]|nr:MAG: NADP oxidoreductase [Candidatus Rokubacteria bacterium]